MALLVIPVGMYTLHWATRNLLTERASYETTRNLLDEHVFVGGGLPAMNDDAIFLTYRVDCIAGKPPPVRCLLRQRYVEDVVAPPKE
ncbi:hypothetical protein [Pseudomonas viridiflava]|uniref:hypothetical protein n=1 Tax=Pseudomonas viridiflava TaxID=33069 RepID=UPI001C31756A|nr:hypothetical protein [Pseudomonas viridiflava]QXG42943.1 hypothetical protein KTT55_10810 [Pseudomonas viridiflava]